MASTQPNNYNFPFFPPPPFQPFHPSPPPFQPFYTPPPPSHSFNPPPPSPPPSHPFAPPPPHVRPPPPPSHPIAPPPPHVHPPPPPVPPSPGPNNHPTVIVVLFVSLGGLLFLSLLAFALCCFIKKRKKRTQETDVIHIDEHKKVKEAIVSGPFGQETVVLSVEDDVHMDEEIKKNEKFGHGLHAKSSADQVNSTRHEGGTTSGYDDHHELEHKP